MRTTLYLLRHAATSWNLEQPPRLQGQHQDLPLAPFGVRQAEATRDFLAVRAIDACYCSPLQRAVQTAEIVASPHGIQPVPLDGLTECDVGQWEGRSWVDIREKEPEVYRAFMEDPSRFGYPGGESFEQVRDRAEQAFNEILQRHLGQSVLVVSHHVVNRVYLATVLGLPPQQARQVSLDNCGISVVVRHGEKLAVSMLNAAFHLQGIAA